MQKLIENKLKNRLARIKKRAMWLRQKAEAREDASATGPLAADDPERTAAPNEIVDEVVKTGAVVRGKDFDKIATLRKRWRRQRRDDASNDFEEEKGREEHPLARFRTGDPQPLESVAPGVVSGSGERSFYLVNARGNEIDPDAAKEARVLGRHNDWPEDVRVSYPGMRRAASSKLPTSTACISSSANCGLSSWAGAPPGSIPGPTIRCSRLPSSCR